MKKRYFLPLLLIAFIANVQQSSAQTAAFWGMTPLGGANDKGVIFKTDANGDNYSVAHSFDDGSGPDGSLLMASNGKLYGLTAAGGDNGKGMLFEYNPGTNVFTKKFDFDGTANGNEPAASLVETSNGKLYGITYSGGANDKGVLFEYDITTNTVTNKFDFDGTTNGESPVASLTVANSKLYGMTSGGGLNANGVIFEYDPTANTFANIFDFDGGTTGGSPLGNLMEATNGNLYGLTNSGGANGAGVLFEYNVASATYTNKLDFNFGTHGGYPQASLIEGVNGKLYGVVPYGGANNAGALFEYDITGNTYTIKVDFDAIPQGSTPNGNLMEAANGKIYGMTSVGGADSKGVLFEYTVATDVFTNKLDFDGTNGSTPAAGHLIEVNGCSIVSSVTTSGASITANQAGATYRWLDCNDNNSVIANETAITYTALATGNYAVEITLASCVDTSACTAITITGIHGNAVFNNVSIYPNPNKGLVNVDLGDLNEVTIKVFNSNGQLVHQANNINTKNYQFEITTANGLYFIELSAKNETRRFKIAKN